MGPISRARCFGMGIAAAALAVGLGAVAMASLGAPQRYIVLNVVGLTAAGGLGALLLLKRGLLENGLGALAFAGAAAIAVTALFGVSLEGVRRWVGVGPVLLHVGFIASPFVLGHAARQVGWRSALAVLVALVGVSLQPDAQTATALAAGVVAIAAMHRSRLAGALAALGITTAAVCWTRPDPLPAVAYVEGFVPLAFAHAWSLGLVASAGLLLPAVGLAIFGLLNPDRRVTALAFAAAYVAAAASALLGGYPTPLVGYGLSPILSYVLFWAVLSSVPPPCNRSVECGTP